MPGRLRLNPNLFFAVYAFLVPLVLGLLANWQGLNKLEDAPAWVQAFGSIAAVAGAAWVGVYQAGKARELAAEQERQREAERLRDRASLLESASTIASWAANRLTELERVLRDPGQAADAARYLPIVAEQLAGFRARAVALGFAQIPRSGREKVFELEHFLSAAAGFVTAAVGDLAAGKGDAETLCGNLAVGFGRLQTNISRVATDLAKLARDVENGRAVV